MPESARDQCPADVVAVDLGEVAVQHHDVVALSLRVGERSLAVEDDIDRHPLTAQSDRDGGGKLPVILDDEHSHRFASRSAVFPAALARLRSRTGPP